VKKKKQKTLRQLKEQCWKLFSEWIRRSHADEGGTVECFTCGTLMFWKDSHAGHFVGGRTNAVLFDERIVKPQCPRCNLYLGGSYAAYTLRMLDEVGREKVDELMALKSQTLKFTRCDLEEKIEMYKRKLETL
jgi:hypothetical protein